MLGMWEGAFRLPFPSRIGTVGKLVEERSSCSLLTQVQTSVSLWVYEMELRQELNLGQLQNWDLIESL